MKRLVLLGAGHAHVHVLSRIGQAPPAGVDVTLISPFPRQVYSGMLPGWISGHYSLEQCVIPLPPLAARAGVRLCQTAASGLDLAARQVLCEDGRRVEWDVLSIDTGPVADVAGLPGAAQHALALRPIESFIAAWPQIAWRCAQGPTRIVFVGAGAAGIELALAMQYRLREAAPRFTLVSAANTLPGRAGPRLMRLLALRGIELHQGLRVERIDAQAVHFADGSSLGADLIIVATGAAAAPWPRAAGLACDAAGFIQTNACLQSISHPDVFAAGDCAGMVDFPRPKSGVYAVRAGPPLAENLRLRLLGEPLVPYAPQSKSLYLVSAGDRCAVGSWGPFSWQGAWTWRWKDRIDREFMACYAGV